MLKGPDLYATKNNQTVIGIGSYGRCRRSVKAFGIRRENMERFRKNTKQGIREIGNSKKIALMGILILAVILIGCAAQEADQAKEEESAEAEDKPHVFTDETARLLIEQVDKALEKAMERSDVNNEEHPTEEEIRTYLSGYFAPDILDYVLYVYQIKIEDGKCFCGHNDYWKNFYMNANGEVRIIEQGKDYCDISVTFDHRWDQVWEDEQVTVRVEKDERNCWVITKMNQWYNDLRYYYMRDTDYEPVYLNKEAAEWLIREFGTDENGENVQICAQTDEDGYILQGSGEHRLTEEEIGALSRYELFLAVQEIYAEAGNLGELAQAAYGNRYGNEEKAAGSPLGAEEAACIIGNAFDGLGEIFAFRSENIIEELSYDEGKYYSLGEYASEEKIKEYISTWFSEETFAYLKSMCGIMYGLHQGKDGTYMLLYDLSLPMDIYKFDHFSGVTIKEYTDTECTVSVAFLNTTTGGMWDIPIDSEGEMVLRLKGDRWVIAEISEPNYDELFREMGKK